MSRVRLVTAFGRTQTVEAWAAESKLDPSAIRRRLLQGRPAEYAVQNHRLKLRYDREMWPGANELPWAEDTIARALVARNGPLSLREVGDMMGVHREQIRLTERQAMRRFLGNARRLGLEREVREELMELARLRDERAVREPEGGGWDE